MYGKPWAKNGMCAKCYVCVLVWHGRPSLYLPATLYASGCRVRRIAGKNRGPLSKLHPRFWGQTTLSRRKIPRMFLCYYRKASTHERRTDDLSAGKESRSLKRPRLAFAAHAPTANTSTQAFHTSNIPSYGVYNIFSIQQYPDLSVTFITHAHSCKVEEKHGKPVKRKRRYLYEWRMFPTSDRPDAHFHCLDLSWMGRSLIYVICTI